MGYLLVSSPVPGPITSSSHIVTEIEPAQSEVLATPVSQGLVKVNDFSLMGRIQKLDETVVLRIAAGEVSCAGAFCSERILDG